MNRSRKELVERLVRFDMPLELIFSELAKFGWDCDEELITLDASSIASVLKRYLSGELTSNKVEDWANAIECREDINYAQFADIIHELANPLLTRKLAPTAAEELLRQIGID